MGGNKSGRCQGEGILVRGKGRVKGPEAGVCLIWPRNIVKQVQL